MPPSTEALYRAALGPAGARAHLPPLSRFEARGRAGPVWHPRAAAGNLAWLVYWRLWDAVLAQASLIIVTVGALGWLWARAESAPLGVRVGLALVVVALWVGLPGFWGVAWLQRGLRQRITVAVEEAPTLPEALERLERSEALWRLRGLGVSAALVLVVASVSAVAWQPWWPSKPAPATVAEPAAPAVEARVLVPEPAVRPTESVPSPQPPPPAPATEPPSEPAPSPASVQRPRARAFGVNVGMYAVEANAQRAIARLAGAGLPVFHDPVESARGPLTRVRVGPFERREQAEQAAARVRALGLEAQVYAP
jgi:cell division septation protein DedD